MRMLAYAHIGMSAGAHMRLIEYERMPCACRSAAVVLIRRAPADPLPDRTFAGMHKEERICAILQTTCRSGRFMTVVL
jgi:hypothetical protein